MIGRSRIPIAPNSAPEGLPVSTIIVAHQIGRRRVPRKCLHDLLGQPLRRRMPGHRKPQQLPPPVAHNKKCKQPLEGQGRNHAEIDRRNSVRMVAQECPPALRWRSSASDHVLGDRRLGDLEPELQQFAMDPRGSPQRVFLAHSSDEIAQLPLDLGSSCPTSGFPAPVGPEPRPMPPQDGGRLNNSGQTQQAGPQPCHQHQQRPIIPAQP